MSATNRGTERNPSDFYPTPRASFEVLLPLLPRDVEFWEPCCGDGRLLWRLQATGRRCNGDDLRHGYDFLKSRKRHEFIITNPPFSIAQEFVSHARAHADETMMLLRLNFLGAQKRRDWWRKHEPAAIFVLSDRPDFTGAGGDATEYGWFYWGNRYRGIFHL